MNALDIVTTHFKLNYFICTQFTFLNQAMTGHNDEELPLVLCQCCPFVMPGFEILMLT